MRLCIEITARLCFRFDGAVEITARLAQLCFTLFCSGLLVHGYARVHTSIYICMCIGRGMGDGMPYD